MMAARRLPWWWDAPRFPCRFFSISRGQVEITEDSSEFLTLFRPPVS
jgi:hypothetical protein